MTGIPVYSVCQVMDEQIQGPMKWVILILGPNHQAKDLRLLSQNDYKNLNIIIIKISNSARNDPLRNRTSHARQRSQYQAKGPSPGNTMNETSNELKMNEYNDSVTKSLNRLARQTPEGYL